MKKIWLKCKFISRYVRISTRMCKGKICDKLADWYRNMAGYWQNKANELSLGKKSMDMIDELCDLAIELDT